MRFTGPVRRVLCDRRLHEFLWFCLPAVLAGALLRVALMAEMPYAIYQPDATDLLATTEEWFEDGDFVVKSKRTFLVPLLYLIACLAPGIPGLVSIAAGQHLLGLLTILGIGGLCRLWFPAWKWIIVPLTLLAAIDPAFLWYEHVAMA